MLLAVDTSTTWIGLALYDGVRVLGEMTWQSQNHHTVELSPGVQEIIDRCGVHKTDLQALAVATGPGSFTSLRIGLALVKGMALALRIPVVGVPTLDILAAAQPAQDVQLAALLQAGRGRLAVGWYDLSDGVWKARGGPQVTNAEELVLKLNKPTLVVGEMSAAERQVLARRRKNAIMVSPANSLRRPSYLAEIAWERWRAGQVDEVVSLSPIYLHVAEAVPA
ncbi:MAG: tRNA (adenosine(37)-N6)-threonylcarbamoyltransferase complex dimerization subunit type 1 TsaB [Anaerolineaceae bacterium]|nr:tRNA (adenosine(37)-N6)-threonylcarbamoyltransferase complex dimerization subunit type 1 TsaB [Anaerolineaceae bacterium]